MDDPGSFAHPSMMNVEEIHVKVHLGIGHEGNFSPTALTPNPKRVERSDLIIPENIKGSEPCLRVHDEFI